MIRPVRFGFNPQTAESNAFMQEPDNNTIDYNNKAQALFDRFVEVLRLNDVNVFVFDDTSNPYTPDSIFPNNWVSFHHSGRVVLYPMEAENRRKERRKDILDKLGEHFDITEIIDISYLEENSSFLEGTGSLILDRINRVAYACLSSRTNKLGLDVWQDRMKNYKVVSFNAEDSNNIPVYHTNVMMCMGDSFVLLCLEAIPNLDEKHALISILEAQGKEIIAISLEQMYAFAGNMLLIKNNQDRKILVMSSQAFRSLTTDQISNLREKADLLPIDLDEIEELAGGSARCMMAEIHLPVKI